MAVTFRNALTNERHPIEVVNGKTVKQAVQESGLVLGDDFSIRDKNGRVVDNEPIAEHDQTVLNIGLPGNVTGGIGTAAGH